MKKVALLCLLAAEVAIIVLMGTATGRQAVIDVAQTLVGKTFLDADYYKWYLGGGVFPAVFLLLATDAFLFWKTKLPTLVALRELLTTQLAALKPETVRRICTTLFTLVVLYYAWQCDDAYHSHVMSRNFANGDGLVYNIGERVMVSTAPLWTIVVGAAYFLTREMFVTAAILNGAFAAGAFYLLLGVTQSKRNTVAATLFASACMSFVAFSTSGLENALLFFLWALLLRVFFNKKQTNETQIDEPQIDGTQSNEKQAETSRAFYFSLVASLILMTRMDHALILLPLFLVVLFRPKVAEAGSEIVGSAKQLLNLRTFAFLALGMSPFIAWEVFSLLYYGFPFPNTAYTKIGTGFPRSDYFERGFFYFVDIALRDLLVLLPSLAIFVFAAFVREWRIRAIAAGVALYWLYLLYIGGDFMAGRHFTGTFFVSLFALIWINENRKENGTENGCEVFHKIGKFIPKFAAIALFVVISDQTFRVAFYATPTVEFLKKTFALKVQMKSWSERDQEPQNRRILTNLFKQPNWGALSKILGPEVRYLAPAQENKWKGDIVPFATGVAKYYSGGDLYYNDLFALGDPFLSRLPAQYSKFWFVGHMHRKSPLGYRDSVRTGINKVQNPALHNFLDATWEITRSPDLFTASRLKTIWKANMFGYADLLSDYAKNPPPADNIEPWIVPYEITLHLITQKPKK
jgi:arabinofuranosyltransferase